MPRLVMQNGPASLPAKIELHPGLHRLGRGEDTLCALQDPSVSRAHCEIVVGDAEIIVRDLQSSNGTFINDQPVVEGRLGPGQRLRLGTVEYRFEEDVTLPTEAAVSVPLPPPEAPAPPPPPTATIRRSGNGAAGLDESAQGNFFRLAGSAFAYPLRRSGPVILVTGAIFFSLLDAARFFARFAPLYGLTALLILTVTSVGYLFAFMRHISVSTAHGEDQIPGWPELSSFWDDLVVPFFQFLTIWIVCLGPGLLVLLLLSPEAGAVVMLLGLFAVPMALLTVSLADSIRGLNPVIVFASIGKVPGPYLLVCLVFLLVLGLRLGCEWIAKLWGVPVVLNLISNALMLYGLAVGMRILGLFYRRYRERLAWFG